MPPDWRVSMITATLLLVLILAVTPSSNFEESFEGGCRREEYTSCSVPDSEKELEFAVEVGAVPRGAEVMSASTKSQRRRMDHNVGHNRCLTLTFPKFCNDIDGINISSSRQLSIDPGNASNGECDLNSTTEGFGLKTLNPPSVRRDVNPEFQKLLDARRSPSRPVNVDFRVLHQDVLKAGRSVST